MSDWSFSYQSESPTGEPWLKPDILEHLAALHGGHRRCPDLSRRVRIRSSGDPLRHRHRGAGARGRARHARLADRDAERRSGVRRALAEIVRRTLVGGDGMTPGRIVVDRVSRTFRVSEGAPHAQGPGRRRAARRRRGRSGRCATSRSRSSPARRSGSSDATAPARRRSCGSISGIFKPTSGRIAVGGRIASLLELGAGFHPDFTGRENVYLNGSIHGLRRARVRELMDEIVAFAELERVHRPARPDVLVRDVHAARLLGRRAHPGRRAAPRRGVRRRRRGVPAEVLRQDPRVQEPRRHDRLRLARRAGGRAALRPRRAAAAGRGRVRRLDTATRSREYRRLLAGERSPEELAAGLREWGSGEARIVSARLLDGDGETRAAAVRLRRGGDVELVVAADAGVAPPRVSLELRDNDGLVLGGSCARRPASSAGAAPASAILRFEMAACRSPTGSSTCAARSSTPGGGLLHLLDDALRFFVFPAGAETGAVLLDGRWTRAGDRAAAPIVPA